MSNVDTFGDRMPLNPTELEYEAIYSACSTNFGFNSVNWVDNSQDLVHLLTLLLVHSLLMKASWK